MEKYSLSYKDMSKDEITRELKKVHKNAKLPGGIDFDLYKDGNMRVFINKPCGNMQTDDAAFEGWILILKYWLNEKGIRIDKIILGWDTSWEINAFNEQLHKNRFLFRIMMFNKMKYMWFEINDNNKEEVSSFETNLKICNLILNGPESDSNKMDEERDKKNNESYIERLFAGEIDKNREAKRLLIDRFNLSELNRQLNVGLFIIPPDKKENEYDPKDVDSVFPGGSGAIDLWGISGEDKIFHVFELKYSNKKIGILSELYCYLMIIFQACCIEGGLFKFTERALKKNIRGSKHLIRDYQSLQGFFLVDKIHPLINEGVINLLNDGLSQIGKIKIGKIIEYEYDGKNIKSLCLK